MDVNIGKKFKAKKVEKCTVCTDPFEITMKGSKPICARCLSKIVEDPICPECLEALVEGMVISRKLS